MASHIRSTGKSHAPKNSIMFEKIMPLLLVLLGILTIVLIGFATGVLLGFIHL